jgi:hypothetical protein
VSRFQTGEDDAEVGDMSVDSQPAPAGLRQQSEVMVRYQLTRAEFAAAARHTMLRRRGFWVSELLAALALAIGVASHSGVLAVTGGALIVLNVASVILGPVVAWSRRAASFSGEQLIRFTDEAVFAESRLSSTTYDWAYFTGLRTVKKLYLLDRQDGRFFIVPQRAFASEGDADQFRTLVAQQLAKAASTPALAQPAVDAQRTRDAALVRRPRRLHAIAVVVAVVVAIGVAVGLGLGSGGGGGGTASGSPGAFAGYSWSGRVTSVQASWVVPRILHGSPRRGAAATWISAQAPASGPFIQIGTNEWDQYPTRRPRPDYFAFWSDTKRHFLDQWLFYVSPGDTVSAVLKLANGRWILGIWDKTSGANAYFSTSEDAHGSFNDASWLQEHVVGFRWQHLAYPRLSAVEFRGLEVNGTPPAADALCPGWISEAGHTFEPSPLHADSFGLREATSDGPAPGC